MNCEEKDVVVLTYTDHPINFSYWDIKRCVKNILYNMIDEDHDMQCVDANQIAQRLESLYHQDFSSRLKEIQLCLKNAKQTKQNSDSLKQIYPGLRQLDLKTLEEGNWLNDVIINKYFALLVNAKPSTCCLSSFFFEALQRHGKHSLPKDLFKKSHVLIPVCLNEHWSLFCAVPSKKTVDIYNSMVVTSQEEECCKTVTEYLQTQYNKEYNKKSCWKTNIIHNLPVQENAYDCGVYICMFARMILFNLSPNINPAHVTIFRNWIYKELISNELHT